MSKHKRKNGTSYETTKMAAPFLYMAVQDIQEIIDVRHALLQMLVLLSGQLAQPDPELINIRHGRDIT